MNAASTAPHYDAPAEPQSPPAAPAPAASQWAAREWPRRVRRGLDVVAVALIVLYVGVVAAKCVPLQGDLRTYVTASRAAIHGLDPYVPGRLTQLAGRSTQAFVYPPLTLALFAPLTTMPASQVAWVWIGIKLALLAGLIALWWRLVPGAGLLGLSLVAVFGWNGSALWDLRQGNVGIVETALIWAALGCFIARRRLVFGALIVAAASFKLVPGALLLLLLVPLEGERPRHGAFAAFAAALAALVCLPMVWGPAAHWTPFIGHVPSADALGAANPGALAFARALLERVRVPAGWIPSFDFAAWLVFAAATVVVSLPLLRAAWRGRDAARWAMAAVFLYVLLEPRPMAYGFVLLVPAPFYFAPRPFHRSVGKVLLALVLAAQGLSRASNHGSESLAFVYSPFLLSLCVWLLVVAGQRRATVGVAPAAITA